MSITDELRKWARDWNWHGYTNVATQLRIEAIANRIDAAHNKALIDMRNRAINQGFDEGFASADDWCAQHEDVMAEHGWIKLPTDAEGVLIRVGDWLAESEENPQKVKMLMLDCDGWSVNFGDGWCLARLHKWHHVKPDTFESIIEDAMRAGRADVAVNVMPLIKRCKALCERTKGE